MAKSTSGIRTLRKRHGLSPLQLGKAVNKSPSTVEAWETGRRTLPDMAWVRKCVKAYLRSGRNISLDNNLLFRTYPLAIARELLSTTLSGIAQGYEYRPGTWRQFEKSVRELPPDVLDDLENKIRRELLKVL